MLSNHRSTRVLWIALAAWAGCGSEGAEQAPAGPVTAAGIGAGTAGPPSGGNAGTANTGTANAGSSAGAGGMITASAGAGSGAGGTQAGMGGGATAGAGTAGEPAADGGSGTGEADSGMPDPPNANCLQGTGDFTDDGPYAVNSTVVTIGSKGMFTIYYPDPLEAACPHPIVAWGNGTTITGGTAYDHFHNHAGSWGIVSIASHNSNVGDGSFHTAAIDYLLAQNEDSGSEFFGKLSTRAGVSGHSQGGAGADRSSTHPNVEAIVNVQGSFGTPPASDAALLCLTGTDDIQPTGCPMAAMAAEVPAVSASWNGADHVSTTLFEGEGIEQYKRLYTAWFRCFLADDADACVMFKGGADCPVCQEDGWDEIFANNY